MRTTDDLTIVQCTHDRHAAAILEIFNDAIVNSTALYDYQPRTAQNMVTWFDTKRAGNWPVIGVEDAQGQLLGFCSWGSFRAYPAYKYTVEHSVYVHPDHQGKGLGRSLLVALIAEAKRLNKHVMVAGIEAQNQASLHLHDTLGFITTGQMPQVGTKFGRWLDLTFMQLQLDDRRDPDGSA